MTANYITHVPNVDAFSTYTSQKKHESIENNLTDLDYRTQYHGKQK